MVRVPADTLLDATIVDERMEVSMAELCRACAVDAERVLEMVEIGLLEPRGGRRADWRFSGLALYRAQTALRLHRDLQVNLAGAALALDLLDEIRLLRRRLGRLE